MEAVLCRGGRNFADDELGMTAVIEFLSAFILFLMVLTSFLSLTQIHLGPNNASIDRLDYSASDGLQRLTNDGGWFVPWQNESRDLDNATSEWQTHNASVLVLGDLLPGLVDESGNLVAEKVAALSNVTRQQLMRGIGLSDGYEVYLSIRVIESENQSRIDHLIFADGTPRDTAKNSAVASRIFSYGDEVVRITLEVHDGSSYFAKIQVTEFLSRPIAGGPEWIELYNPHSFAVDLNGWGVTSNNAGSIASVLFEEGVLAGGATGLLTGWPDLQESGNASFVWDISSSGVLGIGAQNGLGDVKGVLQITRADQLTTASTVYIISWDQTWGIGVGESLDWNGGTYDLQSSWNLTSSPTPGDN